MSRVLALVYGVLVYALFFVSFVYAIGFVDDLLVPKTIDSGTPGGLVAAVVIDLLVLGVFAIQHSVMARPAFKRGWTRVVPKPVERSTYVLFATAALILIMWAWSPIPAVVWSVGHGRLAMAITALSLLGWGTVLISTFLINHFELFGLRQVWANFNGREIPTATFREPLFYKMVRHPIYLGFLIAFWAAPTMTVGRLIFAVGTTLYMLIGIWFEERDLVTYFGDTYLEYRRRVTMIIPFAPK
ncbi:MAG TPA: isoprenylcysteine carboxylmethyltransferase family protein [Caulobacteraceae bacterium]|jgi:protein-S-isoprenylcysteine O-methyltransferase Ste14